MKSSKPMAKNQKLKIGFVFDDSLDRNDGVQQYVKTLGSWLINQGHDVKFLVGETHNAGELQDKVYSLSRNIGVSANKNRLTMPLSTSSKKLTHLFDNIDFDVLNVQVPYSPFMAGRVIMRAPSDTAVVGTFHIVGSTLFERVGSKLLSGVQVRTRKRFDEIVSVSSAAEAFAKEYYKMDSHVVPNMVDVSLFKQAKPKKGNKFQIVFLGRLVKRKGAHHLIEALKLLPADTLAKLEVSICGDGPLRSKLEHECVREGLQNIVKFLGFIDEHDKPQILADADLAVFPSTEGESFGIVLIEAMATGSPVVLGGDNPGYRTVMEGSHEHSIVEVQDHNIFARRIKKIIDDKALRAQLVKWQSQRVKEFDVDHVGRQMIKVYRDAIASRRNP